MEIRARYTLIGLFTLGVMAFGFGFVYWLHTTGGLGQRAVYRIRYDGPVSGLLTGSAVLFNGVRVGEVIALRLDPMSPRDVTVEIAITRSAPVRADTRVGIEFQGLAGAPVVSLSGGTPSLPLLAVINGEPPLLAAEKDAGQSMTQVARDVLRRIDGVVADNADPLRNAIANVDKFTAALARNSDRVDSIIAGLDRLTGGGPKAVPRIYELAAARAFPGLKKLPTVQLQVPEPMALSMFDSEKILFRRPDPGDGPAIEPAHWPDVLPKVIQARVVQSFENAQYTRVLGRAPEGTRSDFQLLIEIRAFQASLESAGSSGEVALAARIVSAEGRVVDARVFRVTASVEGRDSRAAAKALSEAFEKAAGELVAWTFDVI